MRIEKQTYINKVKGAWVGKMVGVSLGIPTEFKFRNRIGDLDEVPQWTPDTINEAYIEDDLYLPMCMMQVLERRGLDASARQMALDLYPHAFEFWGGHYAIFEKGVAPPSSGTPGYNFAPDSLSYAFAADYSGLIAPAVPSVPVQLSDRFARMLVYGDGVLGGAFVGAMYSAAFTTDNIRDIILSGLAVLPEESWLAMAISDTMRWHDDYPDDFTATWQNIMRKYFWDEKYNWIQWPYGGRVDGINLDTKINCSFIVLALLYGGGDPDKTLEIAIRCGADSDCNPSNALGILFTTMGYSRIPEKYKSGIRASSKYRYADITLDEGVELTWRLAYATAERNGGGETVENGVEYLVVKPSQASPMPFENSSVPERQPTQAFSPDEMAQMKKPGLLDGGFEESWHDAMFSPWIPVAGDDCSVGLDIRQAKAHSGDNNAFVSNRGRQWGAMTQKRIGLEPNTKYVLRCYVRTSHNFTDGTLRVSTPEYEGGTVIAETQFPAQSEYSAVELTFDSGAPGIVDIALGYTGDGSSTWMQADDFSLTKEITLRPATAGAGVK